MRSTTPTSSDDYFVPVVLPKITAPPPPRRSYTPLVAVLLVVALGVAGYIAFQSSSSGPPAAPQTLEARTPKAGLPGSLGDAVRMQAEANRHAAVQTVEQANSADPHTLEQAQPSFRWVGAQQASDGPRVVSVAGVGSTTIIAISASNHDVCAFGRWTGGLSPSGSTERAGTAEYVTIAHLPACRAVDAPTAGWSTQAGGAPSDLPDDLGS